MMIIGFGARVRENERIRFPPNVNDFCFRTKLGEGEGTKLSEGERN